MKLSVIVPCFNEEAGINEFYDSLVSSLKKEKITYEIIMINDGSTDDTSLKIKELNKKDKNVKLISFSRNFGKESAMLAGLKHSSGDYISIMDADMQHTPSMLIDLYRKLQDDANYDVACAYKADRFDEGTLKRALTAMFYRINNLISDVRLLPGASDFRIFKKEVKAAIISLPEKTRFLKGIFTWVGFNTIYVPYMPEKRLYGTTKWSLIKLLKYSLGGMISFTTKPLKILSVVSLALFLIGVLNFLFIGSLSYKTVILFLSVLILMLGILMLYISRIYSNILGRPCYIIKEKIGFDKFK